MAVSVVSRRGVAAPFGLCCLLSLGGLVVGATGPLISNFLPLLVAEVLGERRTAIGAVMAIDNVLLLLLVPLAGAVSDRATASGKGRLRFVVSGLSLAAAGMAVLPSSARLGIAGLIGAIVVLNTGLNVQRSPFQALVADLVPSRYRSYATGSVTLLMCIGAILFLMLGQTLGMRPAFYIAAGTVAAIALLYAVRLGEPESHARAQEVRLASLVDAGWSALRGVHPGMRAIFAAAFFVQLTFQTFTTWFALHATERFGLPAEQVTAGFIAWAIGGVLGAVPAGVLGVRIGRRNALMAGLVVMGASLLALDRVSDLGRAVPLLVVASASWTFPTVNSFPLFVEPIPRARRGLLVALFLLCSALGGLIGDPLNGRLFDLFDAYRPLFLMMTGYTALAFLAVLFIPRGTGEADTGPTE